MTRYVALLRGINVGRANRIAMAELRAWVADLGFADVATYIASGNVVFTSESGDDDTALATAIEQRIDAETGLSIAVLVRSHAELAEADAGNPYPEADPTRVLVGFLGAEPAAGAEAALSDVATGDEEVAVVGRVVYLNVPGGIGRSKLGEQLGKLVGVTVTTRNLRTVRKLVELSATS